MTRLLPHRDATAPGLGHGEAHPPSALLVTWTRVGAAAGFLAFVSFAVGSAEISAGLELAAACVFGPALMAFSMGLYHVLRAHRRTVSLDLGLMANLAAGISVTMMMFAQLGLDRWFELEFGPGATESSERALRAGFEAANGIQLGLDVAWDVFLIMGAVLLAWNMSVHPRFGRVLALPGIVIAVALLVINVAAFPEPLGHKAIDLGPVIGLWYVIVSVRLATSVRWAADHEMALMSPSRSSDR